MRKIVTAALVTGVLVAGPLAGFAAAAPPGGPIPTDGCALQKKLGIVNVRECGDPDPGY